MPDRRFKKTFDDGTLVTVGLGRFDDWCLYENQKRIIDEQIFLKLKTLHELYHIVVENDFLTLEDRIFDDLNKGYKDINPSIWNDFIIDLAKKYPNENDVLLAEKAFTILYLTMIAEENKLVFGQPSITGLKIKSVAAYQIMREGKTNEFASDWVDSNKNTWKEQGLSTSKIILNEWKRLRDATEEYVSHQYLFPI